VKESFDRLCRRTATWMGHPAAFVIATALIAIWLIAGLHYGYDDQLYQIIINTVTTIITFLMVFLIQSSQNRDTQAIHLKLDELIRVIDAARDEVAGAEEKTEAELAELKMGTVTPRAISGMDEGSGRN
jgi:low affinity Fe/Cu permease